MGEVALFLSPHLDDVALSCSGFLQALDTQAVIATVFTGSDAANAALYRKRRREDREAAALLGCKVRHLGFLDAPFRSPVYRDFRGIVFGQAREYPATLRAVTGAVEGLLRTLRPRLVVAPLAVGNHVDHRLVRDAALAASDPAGLHFYEDRPYALLREQVSHVLGRSLAARPAAFWKRYFHTPYVRAYLGAADPAAVQRDWAGVPAFPSGYRLRRAWTAAPPRSLAAIAAYRSQTPDLFDGPRDLRARYAALRETYYSVRPRDQNPYPSPATNVAREASQPFW